MVSGAVLLTMEPESSHRDFENNERLLRFSIKGCKYRGDLWKRIDEVLVGVVGKRIGG